ncbi:MAG: hypothetical protein ABIR18_02775, partial [Chitinophagaceae bacterium]
MRKIIFCFLPLAVVLGPAIAQTGGSATNMLKDEKQKFIRQLKSVSIDSVIVYPLARYFDSEVNKIYTSITSSDVAFLPASEKDKAVRSLVYFMTQLSNNIVQQKVDMYDI